MAIAIIAELVAIALVDVGARAILGKIDVNPERAKSEGPGAPNFAQDTDVSPDGRTLYVSRGYLGDVVAFDIASGRQVWRRSLSRSGPTQRPRFPVTRSATPRKTSVKLRGKWGKRLSLVFLNRSTECTRSVADWWPYPPLWWRLCVLWDAEKPVHQKQRRRPCPLWPPHPRQRLEKLRPISSNLQRVS
jgi:hypothetical protein